MMRQWQTARFGVPEQEVKVYGAYRPRIDPQQVAQLWSWKRQTGQPITRVVAAAISQYLERQASREKHPGQIVWYFQQPTIAYCPACDTVLMRYRPGEKLRCYRCLDQKLSLFIWDRESRSPEET